MSFIEWRKINDFLNYEINNKGYVRNITSGLILSPVLNKGYYQVSLCREKEVKHRRIHRLLAIAFIPNPEKKPHVDHIDRNRLNNNLNNLRWVTQKENNNNMPMRSDNSSGVTGVYKKGKKWMVIKKEKYHGLFETKEEARLFIVKHLL